MKNKMSLEVLYEDNHLLVIDKKSGVLVQGDNTGDVSLLEIAKEYLVKKYNKPGDAFLGLVHRLDRPVSGIVLMAKTSKALSRMNKIFKDRSVTKAYSAIILNRPPEENMKLIHYIVKDEKKNRVHVYNREKNKAKKSILHFDTIKSISKQQLIKITLETGRPHQIRAQLSKIGCPIKGDQKYGSHVRNKDLSICLHASSLSFYHPIKNDILTLTSPLPVSEVWMPFNS